jgi:heat shock protein HslJ
VNRFALIALALLLPGCSLFLPTGSSCSDRMPMFSSCPPSPSTALHRANALHGTYWKLVQLNDTAVRDGLLLRESHLRLDANRQQFSGSGGCNQLTGRFAQSGIDGISFSDLASTKMACQGMEIEKGFLKSLERVVRWRIEGERLQLLDNSGKAVSEFRAATSS